MVREGGALFQRVGSTWVQQTVAQFASATDRDAAYAKASGVFRTLSSRARIADRGYETVWLTDKWVGVAARSLIRPKLADLVGNGITIDADGGIRFANCTAAQIKKIFSTDFNAYELEFSLYGGADQSSMLLRFMNGDSIRSGNNYYVQGVSQSGGNAPGAFASRPGTQLDIARYGSGIANTGVATVKVLDPMTATVKTRAQWVSNGTDGVTDHYIAAGGKLDAAEMNDGIAIPQFSTGNFTGTLRVYGLGLGY